MKVDVIRRIRISTHEADKHFIKKTGEEEIVMREEVEDVYQIKIDRGVLYLDRDGFLPTVYANGCWDKCEQVT